MTNQRHLLTQQSIVNKHNLLYTNSFQRRNRQWDKDHQSHKVIYRGVDPKLAFQVKTIAKKLQVPAGEIARAVLKYALQRYEQGELELSPRLALNGVRNTLNFTAPFGYQKTQNKKTKSRWQVITTWRNFSPELKQALTNMASQKDLNVPLGELITALLGFGLQAYESQLLVLKPIATDTGGFTLFPNEGKANHVQA
jgi:hypothetical protein